MEVLRYPYNILRESEDYLKINVIEYKPPGLAAQQTRSLALGTTDQSLSDSLKSPKATIILPMPQNVRDSNGAQWGDDKLGGIGAVGAATAQQMIQGSGIAAAGGVAYDKFLGVVGALTDGTGQSAATSIFAGAAIGALTGQGPPSIDSLVGRAAGAIINQNVELLFQGVTLRQDFQFTFDFVPRFKKEAEEIQKIIRVLKIESAAKKGNVSETGGGFFVKSPNVFQLEYMSGANPHPFLHKFKPTALTGMSVDYTASGTYSSYSDATPVHMQLTLNFRELTPIYAEDYENTKGREGVGY